MRKKRQLAAAILLPFSVGVLALTGPALSASAAQTYVTLGPKTCTGSSYLASRANATIHVQHKVVTTAGQVASRTFTNYTGTYQTSTYYTRMQGSVIYDGHSYVQISPAAESGTIGSASMFCDY